MKRLTLAAALVAVSFTAQADRPPVPVEDVRQYVYAGKSTAKVQAAEGVLVLNAACQDTWGQDARIATTLEVLFAALSEPDGGDAFVVDVARRDVTGPENCKGWSDPNGDATVFDFTEGAFQTRPCTDLCPVACSIKLF